MLKEKQASQSKSSSLAGSSGSGSRIAQRESRKNERLQAMAKISETFGYGEKAKKESPPLKKPLIPTEPRTTKKKTVEAAKATTTVKNVKKTGVKKWEFDTPNAGSAFSSKKKNVDVNPELDGMLAQLE